MYSSDLDHRRRAGAAATHDAGPRMTRAYVALGANLGDAVRQVQQAIGWLAELPQTQRMAQSSLYRSAPVGAQGPDFINAVVALETGLSPMELLRALQALEQRAGRERPYPNAPRTLDLDLLMHGQTECGSAVLTLPHPRLRQRAFVLRPLHEIAPELVDARWLDAARDQPIERLADPAA